MIKSPKTFRCVIRDGTEILLLAADVKSSSNVQALKMIEAKMKRKSIPGKGKPAKCCVSLPPTQCDCQGFRGTFQKDFN